MKTTTVKLVLGWTALSGVQPHSTANPVAQTTQVPILEGVGFFQVDIFKSILLLLVSLILPTPALGGKFSFVCVDSY